MAAPRLMTSETLNAKKGWPSPYALDFNAKFSSSVALDRVPAGAVVSIDEDGEYVIGVGDTNRMPLFLFEASDSPGAVNAGGDPASDAGNWVAVSPAGQLVTLVATGGYELVSTNYDTTDAASYVRNAPLTSPEEPDAKAGKLLVGVYGTDTICGVVSRGLVDNGYGKTALAFWTTFVPVV